MSKNEYSKEQIQELLNNPNIKFCTSKYITFTDSFKIKALELDKRGVYPRKTFTDFGFPEYIINSIIPGESLKRWRFNMKNKGITGLVNTKKGRKKKEKVDFNKMTLEQKIEYLETENAYLKELHKSAFGHYP